MNPHDARQLALQLMDRHGLVGWRFSFDRARQRFGCCHLQRRLITLSQTMTLLNGEQEVRDTILHEIAHALAPRDGHGRKWKSICRLIGAEPKRCYDDKAVLVPPRTPAPYRMGCLQCGWWVDRRRQTRRKLLCRKCRCPVVIRAAV